MAILKLVLENMQVKNNKLRGIFLKKVKQAEQAKKMIWNSFTILINPIQPLKPFKIQSMGIVIVYEIINYCKQHLRVIHLIYFSSLSVNLIS